MGIFNAHAVFCVIIHFVKARCDKEFSEYKSTNVTVTASGNTGSKKLVDDRTSHGTKVEEFLQYFKLVLEVCRHACIAVNLKEVQFLPKEGHFCWSTPLGNQPAEDKFPAIVKLKMNPPKNVTELRAVMGFYQAWILYFEVRIVRLAQAYPGQSQ